MPGQTLKKGGSSLAGASRHLEVIFSPGLEGKGTKSTLFKSLGEGGIAQWLVFSVKISDIAVLVDCKLFIQWTEKSFIKLIKPIQY